MPKKIQVTKNLIIEVEEHNTAPYAAWIKQLDPTNPKLPDFELGAIVIGPKDIKPLIEGLAEAAGIIAELATRG